jgi:hypothetical protein
MKKISLLLLYLALISYGLAQTEFAQLGAKWYFSDGVLRTNSGFYSMFGVCTQCQITNQTNVNGDIVKDFVCDKNGVINTHYIKQKTDGMLLESNDGVNYDVIFNLNAKVGDTLRVKLVSRLYLELSYDSVDTILGANLSANMFWSDIVITKIDSLQHDSFFDDKVFSFDIVSDSALQGNDLAFLIKRFPQAFNGQKFSTFFFGQGAVTNEHFFSTLVQISLNKIVRHAFNNNTYILYPSFTYDENHFSYTGLRLRCYEDDKLNKFESQVWKMSMLYDKFYTSDCAFSAPASVTENSNNIEISIYPNPVSETLQIQSEGLKSIVLTDVSGRVLQQKIMSNTSHAILNVHNLPKGMYVLQVETTRGVHTEKIVKID